MLDLLSAIAQFRMILSSGSSYRNVDEVEYRKNKNEKNAPIDPTQLLQHIQPKPCAFAHFHIIDDGNATITSSFCENAQSLDSIVEFGLGGKRI